MTILESNENELQIYFITQGPFIYPFLNKLINSSKDNKCFLVILIWIWV